MSKSALRFSRGGGSTRRLVEKILARGWEPGLRLRDFYPNRKRRQGAARRE